MEVFSYPNLSDGSTTLAVKIPAAMFVSCLENQLICEITRAIAEKFVEENYAEIVSKLDQTAIANLSIAEASKKIAEEIHTRPVVIHDTKKEVYQRGILGGITRIL